MAEAWKGRIAGAADGEILRLITTIHTIFLPSSYNEHI